MSLCKGYLHCLVVNLDTSLSDLADRLPEIEIGSHHMDFNIKAMNASGLPETMQIGKLAQCLRAKLAVASARATNRSESPRKLTGSEESGGFEAMATRMTTLGLN